MRAPRPGRLLRHQIPLGTHQWDQTRPGFLEADTVAHCGTSLAGMFVYTLDVTDLATGWTEQRAVWGQGRTGRPRAAARHRGGAALRAAGRRLRQRR